MPLCWGDLAVSEPPPFWQALPMVERLGWESSETSLLGSSEVDVERAVFRKRFDPLASSTG